ncbi:DUF2461 domain-containing protein [Muribaculum sp.]|jgi:uncharacterized protein (TIGR02453 family)|uniref:DUF2461 domain-containing protein n=1 Tax=Muribaculum sp. TaxID=1918611 RepID=UPI00257D1048|nr:DUF2461 domain-containing protein [Muribaculum sp.]
MPYYTSDLFNFLENLEQNNNREWFAAHKDTYTALRKLWMDDLARMHEAMCQWEPRLKAYRTETCAYRIYRDTRFSPDKTPYKTYFSAIFSPYGKQPHRGSYYLHMSPHKNESGLFGGVWMPEAPVLKKLRHAIVDNIDEFEEILNQPSLKNNYKQWESEKLKTAPKGWAKDHPQIELLRLKDFGMVHNVETSFFMNSSWPEKAAGIFKHIKPFVDFLNYSIDEE